MSGAGSTPNLVAVGADADPATPPYREPPHNLEAEQGLLGAILLSNEAALAVSGFLEAGHFFEPVHGRIYEAATGLIERGMRATPVTLKTYFERDDALADVGGANYLARLASAAVSLRNAEDYGRVVHDCHLRRELIAVGEDMVHTAHDPSVDEPAMRQIEGAEQSLFQLAEHGKHEGGFQGFQQTVGDTLAGIEAAYKSDSRLTGVGTGLADLDNMLGGLHRSDLIVLAGRPSMGKTALATNIAYHAARQFRTEPAPDGRPRTVDGARVGFFSLEMSAEQLCGRILAEATGIPSDKLRRGSLTDDDFARVVQATQEMHRLPIHIDDTPAISIAALRTRARRLKRQEGLGLIVVDYLQLVRPSGRSSPEHRVQEISEVTQSLKALAKDLDAPVLALSQLSRAVEQRDDKRPLLSDLRESGSIEQDADVVLFIYREAYYLERRQPKEDTPEHQKWQEDMAPVYNKAEIIVGKQRHGPTGKIDVFFQPSLTQFGNLERADPAADAPF